MIQGWLPESQERAIRTSWERCDRQHQLSRHVRGPILRMQSSEIAPRLEQIVERTGGRIGIFRQVAEVATATGQCFSVADAEGVLVRVEGSRSQQQDYAEDGIAAGSCWDERIAGTNGVSMAMNVESSITVRGEEHFLAKFTPFACTSAPLLNADHEMIGIVNLATVDRGNIADYLFAQQLLGAAADRIQRALFERQYQDAMLVSLSSPGSGNLLRSNELVAVNEQGEILGSTMGACHLAGLGAPSDLLGHSFEALFGADAASLDRHPEHVLTISPERGSRIQLSRQLKDGSSTGGRGWQPPAEVPSESDDFEPLESLSVGSLKMMNACENARGSFERVVPFVIEGESGTGKSTLLSSLLHRNKAGQRDCAIIDCSLLDDSVDSQNSIRSLAGQARALGLLETRPDNASTLVFENIDEMPLSSQAVLRGLLDEIDQGRTASQTRVVATVRRPLIDALAQGRFRDDLYYLLTADMIQLPPLRRREHPELLAEHIATDLGGRSISLTPEARTAVATHPWPGNVREMRNVLRQVLVGLKGSTISVADLLQSVLFTAALAGAGDRSLHPHDEETRLLDALNRTRWNVSQAARDLGIGRATINRRISKYGLSRPH